MPPPFHRLSVREFAQLLDQFPFRRQINAVHMHHTWRPRHADFRGHATIESMWRFHTQTNHWSDIAQHLTIDPEGFIWTGRDWNSAPASASGHNGNTGAGPLMFEMIGDFDIGQDPFQDPQKDTALRVVALIQKHFGLAPQTLRFHNQMTSHKSCPGTALDYQALVDDVTRLHALSKAQLLGLLPEVPEPTAVEPAPLDPIPVPSVLDGPFDADALLVREIIDTLTAAGTRSALPADPADAELAESEMDAQAHAAFRAAEAGPDAASRGARLTPEMLMELRPHVINLSQGQFSDDGRFATTAEDVDALFEEHLPLAAKAADKAGHPLRVLFYAHGGLVSETAALEYAFSHLHWWRRNHIYPIFFVWETGLFETIRQLLSQSGQRSRAAASRDIFDYTTDFLVETAARALGGPRIWGGMKWSAEQASIPGGGAHYAARQLAAFVKKHDEGVELHAAGHSAGSIFHTHFLPAALAAGVSGFKTLQLMAPAVRVDTFKARLMPYLGKNKGVDRLVLFTMQKDVERADHTGGVYRKSLLYLIYYALERRRRTPILGLEESIRADRDLKRLFGLNGRRGAPGTAIWSHTGTAVGQSASHGTTHAGFDNDGPTMNSLALRILDLRRNQPPTPYEAHLHRAATIAEAVDWPDVLAVPTAVPPAPVAEVPTSPLAPPTLLTPSTAHQRLALCVGINDYPNPQHRLNGCVADAGLWSDTLSNLGFTTTQLLDGQATRQAVLDGLTRLLDQSRAGDVLTFTFAGHGTQLRDHDGDEEEGLDEAFCTYDFEQGHFLIDDDVYDVFKHIKPGVNFTCFIDCCHSGSITRALFDVDLTRDARPGLNEKKRYLRATEAMDEANRVFRAQLPSAGTRTLRPQSAMRNVLFTACRSDQVAWESNGHGEFTVHATNVLRGGLQGLTHATFLTAVIRSFGTNPRQEPTLDCTAARRNGVLLQPLAV